MFLSLSLSLSLCVSGDQGLISLESAGQDGSGLWLLADWEKVHVSSVGRYGSCSMSLFGIFRSLLDLFWYF